MHHAFQSTAASLGWSRYDVTIAEQELEAVSRKVEAAKMVYVVPGSLGYMSPLPKTL